MDHAKFGNSDLMVSPLGLGCMSMSGAYGAADDNESIATLQRAIDLGINFFDTSASYGKGHNLELIGKAIKGRRDKVVIHCKSGSIRVPDSDFSLKSGGGTPDYLVKTCEQSLKRLGVDAFDVWCMSRVDPEVPIEDSVGAMAHLVKQGKLRYIALSEAAPDTLRRASKVHPLVSLQIEYSMWSRDPESGNIDACRELGMGFMAYAPLGRGFLTGAFHSIGDLPDDDRRRKMPRFQPENIGRNVELLSHIEDLAAEKGATPAQVALAWVMAQGRDIIPIPSAKTRAHLEENIGAVELDLTQADLDRLDQALPPGAFAGTRYPAENMDRLNR